MSNERPVMNAPYEDKGDTLPTRSTAGSLRRRLNFAADEAFRFRMHRSRQTAIVDGDAYVQILRLIFQQYHFHLILLRVSNKFIDIMSSQFGKYLIA